MCTICNAPLCASFNMRILEVLNRWLSVQINFGLQSSSNHIQLAGDTFRFPDVLINCSATITKAIRTKENNENQNEFLHVLAFHSRSGHNWLDLPPLNRFKSQSSSITASILHPLLSQCIINTRVSLVDRFNRTHPRPPFATNFI